MKKYLDQVLRGTPIQFERGGVIFEVSIGLPSDKQIAEHNAREDRLRHLPGGAKIATHPPLETGDPIDRPMNGNVPLPPNSTVIRTPNQAKAAVEKLRPTASGGKLCAHGMAKGECMQKGKDCPHSRWKR